MAQCIKRRFADKGSALLALDEIDRKHEHRIGKRECRTYRCSKCAGWHLTSRASKQSRRAK